MNAKGVLGSVVVGLSIAVSANAAETTAKTKSGDIRGILNLLAETARSQHEQSQEITFPPGDVDKVYELLGREPSQEEMEYLADEWAKIKERNPLLEIDGEDHGHIEQLNRGIHDKREREYLSVVNQLKQKK